MTTNNHPAHGPVSLDRLHQIREILSKAAAQSDGGNLGYAMADAVKVIDGAIAAFGDEPVGYFYAEKPGDWYQISDGDKVPAHRRIPLYSNPQSSPVVKLPNEFISSEGIVVQIEKLMAVLAVHGIQYERRGNAFRAATLHDEPVSNSDELPLDYLQGHKDGLEWAAQLAEANHPQTGDWLYDDPIELARAIRKGPDMPTAQAGNSPVIGIDLASEPDRSVEVRYFAPPGYVMVPKEPTEAMMLHKSGCKDHPWDDPECVMRQTRRLVWAHMLEAAAQQEVKSSLEHGMQRYAGAMQKLADAGD
ncbi:hypothetical protein [Escherichia coli]|uniref:hypothetical protein n=1 Tax=Escherichia coli TaxID=562 RepID=UPI002DB66A7B|nr:hypothetical protein [Escherichia coli]MEC3739467.1 hypothetical protein [Escherichia coli]